MCSQEKKKKKTEKLSLMSLPDELLLSCFARVSRLYYPTLSLVSKRFRSFLASPLLYQTRSLLGRDTESCLYVCLQFDPNLDPCWFTLCHRTLTNGTMKHALARIPSPPSPETSKASFVSVGCNIYAIGGPRSSSNVSILDCRSHTWHVAPSMRVERIFPSPNVYDGQIYVVGGSASSDFMDVFDPKTQTWVNLIYTEVDTKKSCIFVVKSVVIHEEINMVGKRKESWVYNPKEHKCEAVNLDHFDLWSYYSYCVIGNVLYCYNPNEIRWYDTKYGYWRILVVMGGPKIYYNLGKPKLVDYGGKMAVFWDKNVGNENIMVCCTVFALKKRNYGEEILGTIEWSEELFEVSKSYTFLNALAATV